MNDWLMPTRSGWISTSEAHPKAEGQYLVAWRLNKDYKFVISLAWWTNNIAKCYPFKYDDSYKERKGGAWVCSHPEEDFELTDVEYWMEIPPVPEGD